MILFMFAEKVESVESDDMSSIQPAVSEDRSKCRSGSCSEDSYTWLTCDVSLDLPYHSA